MLGENKYGPPALEVRVVRDVPEPEWIPLNRSMFEILEVARKLSGFSAPGYITQETRSTPSVWVCKYHNQYKHNTPAKNVR